jgi:hypothetical protein
MSNIVGAARCPHCGELVTVEDDIAIFVAKCHVAGDKYAYPYEYRKLKPETLRCKFIGGSPVTPKVFYHVRCWEEMCERS